MKWSFNCFSRAVLQNWFREVIPQCRRDVKGNFEENEVCPQSRPCPSWNVGCSWWCTYCMVCSVLRDRIVTSIANSGAEAGISAVTEYLPYLLGLVLPLSLPCSSCSARRIPAYIFCIVLSLAHTHTHSLTPIARSNYMTPMPVLLWSFLNCFTLSLMCCVSGVVSVYHRLIASS